MKFSGGSSVRTSCPSASTCWLNRPAAILSTQARSARGGINARCSSQGHLVSSSAHHAEDKVSFPEKNSIGSKIRTTMTMGILEKPTFVASRLYSRMKNVRSSISSCSDNMSPLEFVHVLLLCTICRRLPSSFMLVQSFETAERLGSSSSSFEISCVMALLALLVNDVLRRGGISGLPRSPRVMLISSGIISIF
jgi:hypothetical protein